MPKTCALCGFASDEAGVFSAHMVQAHAWDRQAPPAGKRGRAVTIVASVTVAGWAAYAFLFLYVSAFCGDFRETSNECLASALGPVALTLLPVVACAIAARRGSLGLTSLFALIAVVGIALHISGL